MAWQFGAATGDDVNYSTSAFGATGNICVIAGWWRPTTLTAGRHYWSVGGVWGGRVDATTSEIALKSDNATTDGEWVTSGLGMATGDFRFLCFLFTVANTGTLIQWRVWQGTLDTRPALVTINQVTAPVGNFTGNTSIVCGNLATSGTVAFQGEFSGPFWGLRSNNSAPDAIIWASSAGQFSQQEEDLFTSTILRDLWLNRTPERCRIYGNWNNTGMVNIMPSDSGASALKYEIPCDDNDPFVLPTYGLNASNTRWVRGPRPEWNNPWVQPNFGNLQRRR